MSEKHNNPTENPQVYKEEEFTLMCEFIELGLWRSTNLSKAVGVTRETIDIWKKYPKAQAAYQVAIKNVIKKRGKVGDVEKIMKELALEVDRTEVDVTTLGLPILGGLSNVSRDDGNTEASQT